MLTSVLYRLHNTASIFSSRVYLRMSPDPGLVCALLPAPETGPDASVRQELQAGVHQSVQLLNETKLLTRP